MKITPVLGKTENSVIDATRSHMCTRVWQTQWQSCEGWHITGLRRSIFISEEETWTLSCLKEPKHHLDTVKLLLSYRQINSASASKPSSAEALQAQGSIHGWSRELHTEPGDSSPNKAPGASAPNPWDTQLRKGWGSARCTPTPPHVMSRLLMRTQDESS